MVSAACGMEPSTATRYLRQLVARGWLERDELGPLVAPGGVEPTLVELYHQRRLSLVRLALLLVANDRRIMQGQNSPRLSRYVVALTMLLMFAAAIAMLVL